MPSRLRGILAVLAASFLLARPAAAGKLDAGLLVGRGQAARRHSLAGAGAPAPTYNVLIRVAPGTALDDLRAAYPGATFRTMAGPIATATVPDAALTAFESDPRVLAVEGARKMRPFLDVARSNATSGGLLLGTTRNSAAADLANATGAGVVIGVIDTGIDFRHKDFIVPATTIPRVLYLWDQTDAAGPAPSYPGFKCTNVLTPVPENDCASTEWTRGQLYSSGTAREYDSTGHGTLVAGLAAGNGTAGTAPGTFVGFAPQADIIAVKTDFSTPGILDGMAYVVARASQLGKRAIINLSLGGQIDPHDGTSLFDAGVDAIAASTPVVVAMGNDGNLNSASIAAGGSYPHAQFALTAQNQTQSFNVNVKGFPVDTHVDLWQKAGDAYTVTVSFPGQSGSAQVASGAGTGAAPIAVAGVSVYVENATGNGSNNSVNEIYVDAYAAAGFPYTTILVQLTCAKAGGCGRVDGYVTPADETTNFQSGTVQTGSMASPATAVNVIAVGSYASKTSWSSPNGAMSGYDTSVLGGLSVFSAWGPTRDGRAKPDVAAPGDVVAAALSSKAALCSTCTFESDATFDQKMTDGGAHAVLAGTSMAAPIVTGTLAGRMAGNPGLSVAQLKAIVAALARTDAGVAALGSNAVNGFGAGKFTSSPQPVGLPTGLTAAALGTSSVTWSWSATLVSADAYDVYYASNPASALALGVQPPLIETGLTPDATCGIKIVGAGLGIEGLTAAFITTATYASAPGAAPAATAFASSASFSFAALQCPAPPAAASCAGYVVQVSTASDFSGTSFSSSTPNRLLTTLQVAGLVSNTAYYARLATLNPLGAASLGPATSFTTTTNLFAPVSPAFDQVSTGTIRFNWSAGANPPGQTYVAQASSNAGFTGTVYTLSGLATNAWFGGLSADTSFYFAVNAVGGPSMNAGPTATLAVPPALSTNSFPSVTTNALAAAWNNVGDQGDTLFECDLALDPGFTLGVVSTTTRAAFAAFSALTPNTAYYLRARAISRASIATSFLTLGSTSTLLQTPTSVAQPFSSQALDGFSFTFNGGGNPPGTLYLVQVATDASFTRVAASTSTTLTTALFSGLQSDQFYFAHAAALNQFGAATAFTAAAGTATLVASPPALAAPVSTYTAVTLGFGWGAGTLAPGTTYQAQLSSSPAFAFAVASSVTLNASAVFAGLQPNTTYYGQVQALGLFPPTPDGAFLSPAAVGGTLAVAPGAAPAAFTGVFFTSATVAWLPLPPAPQAAAAEGYRVELSTGPDFSGVLVSSALASGAAQATLAGLSYATTYYARVASLNWQGRPDYLILGSSLTLTPPLSSGTVSGAPLSLSVIAAPPMLTITVTVPGGTFLPGTVVTALDGFINTSLSSLNGASSNEASITPLGPQAVFCLSAAATCLPLGGPQPAQAVSVSIAYDPLQIPAGQNERALQLFRYDAVAGQWTLVPSHVDAGGHVLTAYVQHFSLFAPFFAAPGSDLGSVEVFPQPWEEGDPTSRYWANALSFTSLPANAAVKLYTTAGELVWSAQASAAGTLTWDGATRFGRRAGSGTYFAVFEAGGATKTRRVVIIR